MSSGSVSFSRSGSMSSRFTWPLTLAPNVSIFLAMMAAFQSSTGVSPNR